MNDASESRRERFRVCGRRRHVRAWVARVLGREEWEKGCWSRTMRLLTAGRYCAGPRVLQRPEFVDVDSAARLLKIRELKANARSACGGKLPLLVSLGFVGDILQSINPITCKCSDDDRELSLFFRRRGPLAGVDLG